MSNIIAHSRHKISRRNTVTGLVTSAITLSPSMVLAKSVSKSNENHGKYKGPGQIWIRGDINEDLLIKTISTFDSHPETYLSSIEFIITSGGGSVNSALILYRYLRGTNMKISTTNIDHVYSAAIIVFLAGRYRTCVPGATFLFHKINTTGPDNSEEGKMIMDSENNINYDIYSRIVSENTKMSKEEVIKIMKETTFISAEKALELGIVHAIEPFKSVITP